MSNERLFSDAEVLQFIHDHVAEHQFPPSITEMADHFGAARSVIKWHLDRMAREGKIRRVARGPRAITILPDGMKQISGPETQL